MNGIAWIQTELVGCVLSKIFLEFDNFSDKIQSKTNLEKKQGLQFPKKEAK